MDFMNRNARPTQSGAPQADSSGPSTSSSPAKKGKFKRDSRLGQVLYAVFFVALIVLVVAALSSVIFSKNQKESQYVDSSKLQAVFLNGGQVYFGNITKLNDKYLKMNNVYYLRVNNQNAQNTQTSANDVSLVKLGCELHGPQDQMLVTKDQVIFWENLKSDGQVAKAVADYVKANPNGQKCENEGTNNNSGNNLQSGSTNTNTQNSPGNTNTQNSTGNGNNNQNNTGTTRP
jgi:hypothetical protein